jgi:hypothetical protein
MAARPRPGSSVFERMAHEGAAGRSGSLWHLIQAAPHPGEPNRPGALEVGALEVSGTSSRHLIEGGLVGCVGCTVGCTSNLW